MTPLWATVNLSGDFRVSWFSPLGDSQGPPGEAGLSLAQLSGDVGQTNGVSGREGRPLMVEAVRRGAAEVEVGAVSAASVRSASHALHGD